MLKQKDFKISGLKCGNCNHIDNYNSKESYEKLTSHTDGFLWMRWQSKIKTCSVGFDCTNCGIFIYWKSGVPFYRI